MARNLALPIIARLLCQFSLLCESRLLCAFHTAEVQLLCGSLALRFACSAEHTLLCRWVDHIGRATCTPGSIILPSISASSAILALREVVVSLARCMFCRPNNSGCFIFVEHLILPRVGCFCRGEVILVEVQLLLRLVNKVW